MHVGSDPGQFIAHRVGAEQCQRETMLKRPQTDPVFIDVANYTDYYRLRASFTATDYSSPRFRRCPR